MNGREETITPDEPTRVSGVGRVLPQRWFRGGAGLLPLAALTVTLAILFVPAHLRPDAGKRRIASAISHDACNGAPVVPALARSGKIGSVGLRAAVARLPLRFEMNRGQAASGTDFLARGAGYRLSLMPTAAELSFTTVAPERSAATESRLRVHLVGANPAARATGQTKLPGTVGYYLGRDPAKWHAGIPTYAAVRYGAVYPGVDLTYYGNQQQLEYDFVVAPGADPARIQLAFAGANKLEVDKGGDLVLHVAGGTVRQHKPVIYQEKQGARHRIPGRYVLKSGQQVGFEVAQYDTTRPLVIDPVVSYSTYIGGGDWDEAHAIAVDGAGNTWVTGATYYGGTRNIFIRELNPQGSALLLDLTYGDGGEDEGNGIAVDPAGNAYITGKYTFEDAMFPGQGIWDDHRLFVLKLSPTGTPLYFAAPDGSNDDMGRAIAVTTDGYACVTGNSSGGNIRGFPIVNGLTDYHGFGDAIVMVLNPAGNGIVYSTYLGTSGVDQGDGIAVANGYVYVTGLAGGPEFPITVGAFQTQYGGWIGDAFVTKIDPSRIGTASIIYSTFLGGDDFDEGGAIAVDAAGNAYVTGSTNSNVHPFPTTVGAYQAGWGGGDCDSDPLHFEACSDAFVTKLNPNGTGVIYSTYIGGVGRDEGDAITVDAAGNAYITGTCLGFFPTVNSLQAYAGGRDAFLTKVNPTGTALVYSSFVGGSGGDDGTGIARDSNGNIYIAGYTDSTNYPTTAGAFHTAFFGGGMDPFVIKIAETAAPAIAVATVSLNPTSVTGGATSTGTVTLTAAAPAGGATVTLTSDNTAAATVPASVPVPAGQTSATFTVTAKAVTTNAAAAISAAYGGVTKSATLTVNAPTTALASVTLNPTSVTGGANATGTVTLTGLAQAAITLTLTNSNTADVTVPATVTVAAGAKSATFTVTTKPQAAITSATISATYGGVNKTATITVKAPVLSTLTLAPASVAGGSPVTATVTLSGTAVVATTVTLASSNTAVATIPASVTVAPGAKTAKATITTTAVTATATSAISATLGAVTKTVTLTVNPTALASVALAPNVVGGGGTSTGTMTLTGPAAAALTVTLTSANPAAATVPASVTIAAGAKTAKFTVTTKTVTANTAVAISAAYGGVTKSATLTINAAALASVTLNPSTVKGGSAVTGTVTFTAPVTAATTVTLTSNKTAVATVPASITVAAGASSATFTVTTKAVTANTAVTIKATAGGISKTAALTVTP